MVLTYLGRRLHPLFVPFLHIGILVSLPPTSAKVGPLSKLPTFSSTASLSIAAIHCFSSVATCAFATSTAVFSLVAVGISHYPGELQVHLTFIPDAGTRDAHGQIYPRP